MLNEQQVIFIQNQLQQTPLQQTQIKEELLDHLCCDIEFQLAAGIPFHTACTTTFDTFREDEMQEIEQHFFNLNNQQHLIMKKVSILALGLMLIATTIFALKNDPPSRSPLNKSEITSGFGQRKHPISKKMKHHKGVDFKAKIGTPIYATSDGVVEKAKEQSTGHGNHVVVKHDETFSSLYGQMSAIKVEEGQKVKKGDLIGLVGSSGASTGPHLHYEVWKDGEAVNPEPYLQP